MIKKETIKKYVVTTEKYPRLACVKHRGEHPFFFKESVNGFVTYCYEVMSETEYFEAKEKEGIK